MAYTLEDQIRTFGETVSQMRDAASHNLGDPVLLNIYAVGILSDAQEMMLSGDISTARQFVNKAKYFIQESTSLQRKKEQG